MIKTIVKYSLLGLSLAFLIVPQMSIPVYASEKTETDADWAQCFVSGPVPSCGPWYKELICNALGTAIWLVGIGVALKNITAKILKKGLPNAIRMDEEGRCQAVQDWSFLI